MDSLYIIFYVFFIICVVEFIYKYSYLPKLREAARRGYEGDDW